MKRTTEQALDELNYLIRSIDKLQNKRAYSAQHEYWLIRTCQTLQEVFGETSIYYERFSAIHWIRDSVIPLNDMTAIYDIRGALKTDEQIIYLEQLDTARGLLIAARDYLQSHSIEEVYKGDDTGRETTEVLKVLNLAEVSLRKVIRDRPEREKQVQDAFESLLIGANISYTREAESIEYSTKKYIPDFFIHKANLFVEVKLCNREGRQNELIAEINDDILAYQAKYENIIFVIYDTGYIRDIDRFISNFEKNEGVIVRVIKH